MNALKTLLPVVLLLLLCIAGPAAALADPAIGPPPGPGGSTTGIAPSAPGAVTVPAPPPGIAWQRLLGGRWNDEAHGVQQTADGGYVLIASSLSSATGNVTETTGGGTYSGDAWLVKTDAAGAIQWQHLLGGNRDEDGYSVQQTADGGYVAFGSTNSDPTGDVTGTYHGNGYPDYWLVKVNAAGQKQWDRVIGGTLADSGRSVHQTADGGYILAGTSSSNAGGDVVEGRFGDEDAWVVRVNATGVIQWRAMLGGSSKETAASIRQTADGGYILVGSAQSSRTGDVSTSTHGLLDVWAVKLNAAGAIQWQQQLGGSRDDTGACVRQTADGGYILVGDAKSGANGTVTEANHGPVGTTDLWVVKLSSTGAVQWNRLLGGAGNEHGRSVGQTADGGYILLGDTSSSESGDVTGTTRGGSDYWVVALDGAGALRWQRLYGGSANEFGGAAQQTADGGYILAGTSGSSRTGDVTGTNWGDGDAWLVKLDAAAPTVVAVPGGSGLPTDAGLDGVYEDVNGNGRRDFADVVLFFTQMSWIAAHEPVAAFDYNANGRIDFADVTWLFAHL